MKRSAMVLGIIIKRLLKPEKLCTLSFLPAGKLARIYKYHSTYSGPQLLTREKGTMATFIKLISAVL